MKIDEAIKHCLNQARKLQDKADKVDGDESRQCTECAADHIQLAEWLVELKDLRAEQHEQDVFIKELMKHSASDECGRWIDTHGTYIDELDGWYMESKCSLCGKYTVSYEKYGVHQKCEYCSHCGKPMK